MKVKFRNVTMGLLSLIAIPFVISCGSSPKSRDEGFKVTLQLSLAQAAASIAVNPEDSAMLAVLYSADALSTSAESFADTFFNTYQTLYPEQNAALLFLPSVAAGESREAAIAKARNLLLTTINNKRATMTRTLTRRLQEFCQLPAENISIKHEGHFLTISAAGLANEQEVMPVLANATGLRFWAVYSMNDVGVALFRADSVIGAEKRSEYMNAKPKPDSSGQESLTDMALNAKSEDELKSRLFALLMPAVDSEGKATGASYIGIAIPKDTAELGAMLRLPKVAALFPPRLRWMWGALPGKTEDMKIHPLALYAIEVPVNGKPLVDASDINKAYRQTAGGKVEISMSMNPLGAIKWQQATRQNINRAIAIEMGNFVYSAPNVLSEISGGRSSLTGDFSEAESQTLVNVINGGALPIPFTLARIERFSHKARR